MAKPKKEFNFDDLDSILVTASDDTLANNDETVEDDYSSSTSFNTNTSPFGQMAETTKTVEHKGSVFSGKYFYFILGLIVLIVVIALIILNTLNNNALKRAQQEIDSSSDISSDTINTPANTPTPSNTALLPGKSILLTDINEISEDSIQYDVDTTFKLIQKHTYYSDSEKRVYLQFLGELSFSDGTKTAYALDVVPKYYYKLTEGQEFLVSCSFVVIENQRLVLSCVY